MALQGLPQRNLHQFIVRKMASSRMLVRQVREWMQIWGKSALMRIARLMNSLAKGPKRMVTKVQWLYWKLHDNWVAYFKILEPPKSSSILRKRSNMLTPIRCVRFTEAVLRHIDTRDKILRLKWFAQVNLISVAPTLQNLRIGLRRRQSGKRKVPVKQRGSWPKVF